jgi:hypothetical protein
MEEMSEAEVEALSYKTLTLPRPWGKGHPDANFDLRPTCRTLTVWLR